MDRPTTRATPAERRVCWARLRDLHTRLDQQVHVLYLAADTEYPPSRDYDRDACALHNDLVENDATCANLLEQIATERIVLADLNRLDAA